MAFRDRIARQSMRLLQDPRVMRVLRDERVVHAVIGGLRLRGRMQETVSGRIDEVARRLGLATMTEVRELKRELVRLERELDAARSAR